MGTVYKKTVTRPMPDGAELYQRRIKGDDGTAQSETWARWRDGKGRARQARVTESGRVSIGANTYTAKYRDGQGIVREAATGCRDRDAARSVLTRLERESELVRAGVMTASGQTSAFYAQMALAAHIDTFIAHLAGKGTIEHHRKKTLR